MFTFLGLCVQNLIRCFKYLFSGQARFSTIISQASAISYDSLPISLMIVFIASLVMTIQVAKSFAMSGADTYIGGSIAIVMIREIAPGFVALAIGARAGTAISAEIANMQVTSQVDALKTLKVDPVGYYFTPRILAGLVTVPMVVLLAEFVGIVGGMFVAQATIDLGVAFNKRCLYKPFQGNDFWCIDNACVRNAGLYNHRRRKAGRNINDARINTFNNLYACCGFFN